MKLAPAVLVLANAGMMAHAKVIHKLKHLHTLKLKPEVASQVDKYRNTLWGRKIYRVFSGTASTVPCSDPSIEFITPLISNIDIEDLQIVLDLAIDLIPLYYSLLVSDENDEYFGTFGEETSEVIIATSALETFWALADDDGAPALITDNILVLGMHGANMKDREKLIPTLKFMYDLREAEIDYSELADSIQLLIETFPHEYDHPIFTFNAFSSSDGMSEEKIILGDGIMEFLQFKNLGSNGPEVVLSHEFGHQMLFEVGIDLLEDFITPSESRRIELMADAFSGYFLAHRSGGNIQDYRVLELTKAAFAVGDCDIESVEHHGTPLQRECAMSWGINQAALSGGTVIHPNELQALFDKDLHLIVDVNKSVCRLMVFSDGSGGFPGYSRAVPKDEDEDDDEDGETTVTVIKTTTTETKRITKKKKKTSR